MDFLGLIKEIVSIVVVANAVVGNKDESMSEDYKKTLEAILNHQYKD